MAAPKGKRKSKIDPNETKAQKFVRLANHRINRILKLNKALSALGGAAYESTPEQRKRIGDVLKTSLEAAVDGMSKVKVATNEFKL